MAAPEISWEVRGTDRTALPLLFVPPLGRARGSAEPQVAAFEGARRCVLFDPRGIGASKDVPAAAYTAGTIAEDAAAALDLAEVPRAHVVGWSLGAGAATLLALDRPERVASLTLLTPWARVDPHLAGGLAILRDMAAHAPAEAAELATLWLILSREAVDAAGAELAVGARAEVADPGHPTAAVLRDYAAAAAQLDVLDRLGSLAVPTLVVGGAEDRLVDVAHARETAAAVPGAVLHVLEGVGATHALPVERADEVNALIRAFVETHEPARGRATIGEQQ